MEEYNKKSLNLINSKLTIFINSCRHGVSSIDSISSWVQLMSCTRITHGSTLSYTRLVAVPEVMRWRDILYKYWGGADKNVILCALGTMTGVTIDRHVFTSSIQHGPKWKTKKIKGGVMGVLQKYDVRSTELKEYYYNEIKERSNFPNYGWIITDYRHDGINGKQLTMTTYI